jgi:hypothetical protein
MRRSVSMAVWEVEEEQVSGEFEEGGREDEVHLGKAGGRLGRRGGYPDLDPALQHDLQAAQSKTETT